MTRSSAHANQLLAAQSAMNAADARTRALLVAGVAEARRLKAARAGALRRFWRYIASRMR